MRSLSVLCCLLFLNTATGDDRPSTKQNQRKVKPSLSNLTPEFLTSTEFFVESDMWSIVPSKPQKLVFGRDGKVEQNAAGLKGPKIGNQTFKFRSSMGGHLSTTEKSHQLGVRIARLEDWKDYRRLQTAESADVNVDLEALHRRFTLYKGFDADRALLTKTNRLKVTGGKFVSASSAQACRAAQRVFSRVSFLFQKRQDVVQLLGLPLTISDYNEASKRHTPNTPLVYVFDSGFGGLRYTLLFENGICIAVKVDGLN
ncbi:MAG: hypothetical protein CMJ78_05305 [Planctomycetaceae bacterium]|nr:hypothetical protein [Planctomycetaceae bacterium]